MLRTFGWLLLNTVQTLGSFLWTGLCATVAIALWIGTGFRRRTPLALARRIWSPGILWIAGAKLTIERPDGVDWASPHVYVMNHQSMADIPAGFVAVPTPLVFIAKQALQYVPFLGWYMTAMGMIFVDRRAGERAIRSLERAGAQIRAGRSVLAFPEGTRTRDGRVQPFKKGPFVVALQAQVPIVPIAIEGAQRLLPRGGFRFRPAMLRVKLGRPIPTAGLTLADRDALIVRVRHELLALHESIGGAQSDRDRSIADRGAEGSSRAAAAEPAAA